MFAVSSRWGGVFWEFWMDHMQTFFTGEAVEVVWTGDGKTYTGVVELGAGVLQMQTTPEKKIRVLFDGDNSYDDFCAGEIRRLDPEDNTPLGELLRPKRRRDERHEKARCKKARCKKPRCKEAECKQARRKKPRRKKPRRKKSTTFRPKVVFTRRFKKRRVKGMHHDGEKDILRQGLLERMFEPNTDTETRARFHSECIQSLIDLLLPCDRGSDSCFFRSIKNLTGTSRHDRCELCEETKAITNMTRRSGKSCYLCRLCTDRVSLAKQVREFPDRMGAMDLTHAQRAYDDLLARFYEVSKSKA